MPLGSLASEVITPRNGQKYMGFHGVKSHTTYKGSHITPLVTIRLGPPCSSLNDLKIPQNDGFCRKSTCLSFPTSDNFEYPWKKSQRGRCSN